MEDGQRRWWARHRLDIAVFVFVLALVAPWVHLATAQVSSRYTFSAALVEQGTIRLDDYVGILGVDRVEIDGHVYSDKAPGQPVVATPAVALGQALGAEPATVPRFRGNLGIWPATFVSAMVPLALLAVVMRRHADRFGATRSLMAALGLACTTMLLPMGADLYSHVLAGLLGFGAWHVLSRTSAGDRWPVAAAGAMAGFGFAVEYPVLGVAGVLGLFLLVQRRWRDAVVFGVAALPFVVGVAVYHWVLLGDPTESPYTLKDGGRLHLLELPGLENTIDVFFGNRGFVFTPVVLLGIGGLVMSSLWRRSLDPERLVAGAVIAGFLVLQIGWNNPWTGDSPGPRLVTPAIPFLVVPLALVLGKLRPAIRWAGLALGAVSMGLALVTLQLLPSGAGLISGHIDNLTDDRIGLGETVFTLALGDVGWLPHVVLLFAAGAWLTKAVRERPVEAPAPVAVAR